MKMQPASLGGAFVIDPDLLEDERGFFARTYCRDTFAALGLRTEFVQSSISYNFRRATLRGLHYQAAPHAEAKIVRCTRGSVFDVIVDLRRESGTYRRWFGIELSAESHRSLYVPEGVAHGFITLTDDAELLYEISTPYVADSARGVRWDDPAFGITWPLQPIIISARDRSFNDLPT